MIKQFFAAAAALAFSMGVAIADDGHNHADEHAHDHGPKHGGVVEHSSHHHVELVAKGGDLTLYITNEDGTAEDVAAAKATATVLAGSKTETLTLAPAGGNALKGSGGFSAGSGTTVVVSLTMPDHEPEQVRFKLD